MRATQVQLRGQEDPLEKGVATHSSILAWQIPWTKWELQSWVAKSLTQLSDWHFTYTDSLLDSVLSWPEHDSVLWPFLSPLCLHMQSLTFLKTQLYLLKSQQASHTSFQGHHPSSSCLHLLDVGLHSPFASLLLSPPNHLWRWNTRHMLKTQLWPLPYLNSYRGFLMVNWR